ncbi:hypothetical protein GCM10011385_39120 [Nitratireductor aestuarii]|uniref:TRAP transporter small permease protein n=1 Tax=Nitratireductor aestuarii TaxID=1735103 RepID=A0A916S327_9HYPH|nr:TRAP transporter small permease [Nitratireductor aestuarii]GGA81042.1 hypothetical protein GCM10011385_39120 [Nitratireductor aestuarii]
MLRLVERLSGLLSLLAAQVAVVILVSVTALILTEIVLRSFFATSTNIVEEYVAYGLGTMVFLGLGQAMRSGSLVRVDIVLGKLGPASRRCVEITACVAALIVMSFVLYYLSIRIGRDFSRGTISMTKAATKMWIPNAIVATGMAIFMLQVLVYGIGLCFGRRLIRDEGAID